MPIETDTELTNILGWPVRLRRPQSKPIQHIYLLLHGWTGNENVMWVFANHFSKNAWILSPRGLHPSTDSGYGWTETRAGLQATIQDYLPAVERVVDWVNAWVDQELPAAKITLVGFSQGAALSYCIGLIHPQRIGAIAGLAGFLPAGSDVYAKSKPLISTPIFVAHGTRDDTVPVERARQAVQILEQAGANVSYCESNVGHKLGANCMHGLDEFVARTNETTL